MRIKHAKSEDLTVIMKIVDRAAVIAETQGLKLNRISLAMDISAVHANNAQLRLTELLVADDFNFIHDVFGIMQHIDRKTGKLQDFFCPRYARPEASHAH